jgi:predicted O-methyltransferase YrrM
MKPMAERPLPERVAAAQRQAAEAAESSGFAASCIPEVGRLLSVAAAAKPAGVIAESGTGVGVGTAWLHSGLGSGARLVTVERDADRAARAAAIFADDPRVECLVGDWRLLEAHAPFDVFFCDGGGKREDPERVVELLAPGGLLILDDFTPPLEWPPRFEGEVDELRLFYLGHPALSATEVMTTPDHSAIIATRLARGERPSGSTST